MLLDWGRARRIMPAQKTTKGGSALTKSKKTLKVSPDYAGPKDYKGGSALTKSKKTWRGAPHCSRLKT